MNNTKSQNDNLHPLTLLVKKIKKFSEKSGLTSEREKTGGVGMAFAGEAANRGGHGGFLQDQKHKKPIICVQNIHFPANTERKRPKIDHKRPKIDHPP
mgnify:CR=1 FL=1